MFDQKSFRPQAKVDVTRTGWCTQGLKNSLQNVLGFSAQGSFVLFRVFVPSYFAASLGVPVISNNFRSNWKRLAEDQHIRYG